MWQRSKIENVTGSYRCYNLHHRMKIEIILWTVVKALQIYFNLICHKLQTYMVHYLVITYYSTYNLQSFGFKNIHNIL